MLISPKYFSLRPQKTSFSQRVIKNVHIITIRHFRRKMLARQAGYSPENLPNDDVAPPDNQQLIPNAGSFYEECIPMKG